MKKIAFYGSIFTAFFLGGCGGSSSSSDGELNGYFIDAAVEGVEYTTSSGLSGITNAQGKFRFRAGDSVEFSIGKVKLGEATLNSINEVAVTPLELCDNNESKLLLLQTLQALDSDNNTSNGITIPSDLQTALNALNSTIDLSTITSVDELLNNPELSSLVEYIDEDSDGSIDVNATEAVAHFNESMYTWQQTHQNQTHQGGRGRGKGNGGGNGHGKSNSQTAGFDLENYFPTPNLSQRVMDTIAYMGNEERLAYDVYSVLYQYHYDNSNEVLTQLQSVATNSEAKHIAIVQSLVSRYNLNENNLTDVTTPAAAEDSRDLAQLPTGVYDIQAIQDLYNTLVAKGKESPNAALEVGCMVEVTDINDLNEDIDAAKEDNAYDVAAAFEALREGSYKHYWIFDAALKSRGVVDGCCSLGDAYCHTEYPNN